MARDEPFRLPFDEQIEFFRDKTDLPTQAWTDIYLKEHDRAFVVAGAMKAELLADLRQAIEAVISEGRTLEWFRDRFDDIVERHGWRYNGGRGWRTRVIYETNLYTSYAAGRLRQMTAIADLRPYWRYRHSDWVTYPRPIHQSWDGLVIRMDDPWWETHYPPNGWGCKCYVETLSEAELKRSGKSRPDEAPPTKYVTKTIGIRGPSPRTVTVPKGIDPGFEYTPGRSLIRPLPPRSPSSPPVPQPPLSFPDLPDPRPLPDRIPPSGSTTPKDVLEAFGASDTAKVITPEGGGAVVIGPGSFADDVTQPSLIAWLMLIALTDPDEAWAYIETVSSSTELRRRLIRRLEGETGALWAVYDWGKSGWSAFFDASEDTPRAGVNTWNRTDG